MSKLIWLLFNKQPLTHIISHSLNDLNSLLNILFDVKFSYIFNKFNTEKNIYRKKYSRFPIFLNIFAALKTYNAKLQFPTLKYIKYTKGEKCWKKNSFHLQGIQLYSRLYAKEEEVDSYLHKINQVKYKRYLRKREEEKCLRYAQFFKYLCLLN